MSEACGSSQRSGVGEYGITAVLASHTAGMLPTLEPPASLRAPFTKECKHLSDPRKPIKDNLRAYGCVFDGCYERFGSMKALARHESRQRHVDLRECYRCQGEHKRQDGSACFHVSYGGARSYTRHLEQCGVLSRWGKNTELMENHIDLHNFRRFWCGFCDTVIILGTVGRTVHQARFRHLDAHFSRGTSSADWIEHGGNGRPKQLESSGINVRDDLFPSVTLRSEDSIEEDSDRYFRTARRAPRCWGPEPFESRSIPRPCNAQRLDGCLYQDGRAGHDGLPHGAQPTPGCQSLS